MPIYFLFSSFLRPSLHPDNESRPPLSDFAEAIRAGIIMITMELSVAFLLLPLLALSGVLGVAQGRWSETRATRYNPIEYTALASRRNGHEHVDDGGSLISAAGCSPFFFLFCVRRCTFRRFTWVYSSAGPRFTLRANPTGRLCQDSFRPLSPSFPTYLAVGAVSFINPNKWLSFSSCHPAERALGSSGSSASQSEEVVTRAPQRKRKL